MANERMTEHLVLKEMCCSIGKNDFGYVFSQGDIKEIDKIEKILKRAGGKPKDYKLDDFSKIGKGKAQPEYIITFNNDPSTIIVIECKKQSEFHSSSKLDQPKNYAVDGVLYYAKFLKEKYNVIAIAISGTKKDKLKVSTYHWLKCQDNYMELKKATDIILEPINYLKLVKGQKLQKQYSLEEIRATALEMHDTLRQIKIPEKYKPIFVAGILIALENKTFADEYQSATNFKSIISRLNEAIEEMLNKSDIKKDKIESIKSAFKIIGKSPKLAEIQLGHYNSITWYIEQLEMKIKPMMDCADSTIDALSVFYHEFVKYSGGDGSGLGIILTPQHLTDFMCELAGVSKTSRVIDICCGSGSFLVSAMQKMFKNANPIEIKKIKSEGLYGIELDDDLFTLAITNMIIRKDGKSNITHGDCFNPKIVQDLKNKNLTIGLINPPYSQDDYCELEFAENMLDILVSGGTGVVVVPMSCAIGTKFKEIRERLFKKHTLKAVFSMPDDIFYPAGTNVCVMVWEAHKSHDITKNTFFGFYKNDGFVKAKKLGRIDKFDRWEKIKKQWLQFYENKEVKDGLTAKKCITWQDEWLCEAYMETDYTNLTQDDFQQSVNNYLAYLIKSGD